MGHQANQPQYVVWGTEHPAFSGAIIGTYRRRWAARLAAWWFERTVSPWPRAWIVVQERTQATSLAGQRTP